ncbi:MAG: mandelate racemase/muconate lactonizing enzyme family protein [Caldilineaceae bacterium]|nr:mandelate racemase/muconate lactonizing enzyme family protein [Caldilineaceae bacterium]
MSHQPLTFEQFRVWEVVVPARPEIVEMPGDPGVMYKDAGKWPQMPLHLVEGTTSEGFVAIGECNRGTTRAVVEATLQDLLGRDLRSLTPATIWQGPANATGLPRTYPYWSWELAAGKSYMLLEALWLDAMGKASGMPAHQLLGGACRTHVPVDFWINRPAAPTMAKLIAEAVELGLRGVKMKSSAKGDTVEALLAIAADIPHGFHITLDPMCAWRSLRECARQLEQLAKLPFDIQIEDPFPYTNIDDWRAARQISPLTIACHTRTEDVLQLAMREEMADTYNLGRGSVYDFLRLSHVTEFIDKDCWQGSSLELGVLQHMRLHASACARNCVLPSDLQGEWVREHTLVTPRMQYEDGHAVLPDRPGLGIELDHAAMQPYITGQFEVA